MSVESAWDAELAAAGEVLDSEHQRYIAQAHEMGKEIERLRAEVERLRRELTMANRSGGFYFGRVHPSHKVDL